MTGSLARVRDLNELAAIWSRRGLRVLEMPGWQDRGRESGNTFEVLGCHHTAAAQDIDRVLRDGREDLAGPLCNVALHANGDVVLVASGRANHFGVATWPSLRALGVEATGPPFTNYPQYVQLAAGFCEWKWQDPTQVVRADTAIDVYLVAAHKEVATPYGRKPNPAGFGFNNGGRTIAGVQLIDDFRTDVTAALAHQEEDDMTPEQAQQLQYVYDTLTSTADGQDIDLLTKLYRLTTWGTETKGEGRPNLADVLEGLQQIKDQLSQPPA